MTLVVLFLVLIFLELLAIIVGALLAWQKVSIFLTYNTRYDSAQYELDITHPKPKKPFLPAAKTEETNRGRSVKQVDELLDLDEVPFEDAVTAIESIGEGNGA